MYGVCYTVRLRSGTRDPNKITQMIKNKPPFTCWRAGVRSGRPLCSGDARSNEAAACVRVVVELSCTLLAALKLGGRGDGPRNVRVLGVWPSSGPPRGEGCWRWGWACHRRRRAPRPRAGDACGRDDRRLLGRTRLPLGVLRPPPRRRRMPIARALPPARAAGARAARATQEGQARGVTAACG